MSTRPRVRKSFLNQLNSLIKKILRVKNSSFEESVSELIKEHNFDSTVHNEEKTILRNILTFGDLEAKDVMLPRSEIKAVPVDIKLADLKSTFTKCGHSRLPVYKESLDEILGFVHVKDVFKLITTNKKLDLKTLCRELILVPKSIKITDLLTRMKQSRVHIAVVLDEHGGTDGLVTIEDIIEEIFGEIVDEYDETISTHIKYDGENFIIDPKVKIEEIEEELNILIEDENSEYDTLAGLIMSYLGRIPRIGEKFTHPSGIEIEILDATERKIKNVKVKVSPRDISFSDNSEPTKNN